MSARKGLSCLMLSAIVAIAPQLVEAQCPVCGNTNYDCQKCKCGPTKIVIKQRFGCGCCSAPYPPYGVPVVGSVAAAMVPVTATPVNFTAAPASPDFATLAAFAKALNQQNTRPAAAAASSDGECSDPCGSIKQLRRDVDDLLKVTTDLSKAVNVLSVEYKKSHEKPADKPVDKPKS